MIRRMDDDEAIARRALDLQSRAKDFGFVEIPAYKRWSDRKLSEGLSAALIANLDARSMWLLPEEVERVTEDMFEELLQDLIDTIGDE